MSTIPKSIPLTDATFLEGATIVAVGVQYYPEDSSIKPVPAIGVVLKDGKTRKLLELNEVYVQDPDAEGVVITETPARTQ